MLRPARSGQAMIETVLAVLVISFCFMLLFRFSQMVTSKIFLEHAAMRVARARAVGLNDFMCEKAARVAVIPVAGERLWPIDDNAIDWAMELARIPDYMYSENGARARGVLEYEGWDYLKVEPGDGRSSRVSMDFGFLEGFGGVSLDGEAGIEQNASFYLSGAGQ